MTPVNDKAPQARGIRETPFIVSPQSLRQELEAAPKTAATSFRHS
jgi:hypothetical protein